MIRLRLKNCVNQLIIHNEPGGGAKKSQVRCFLFFLVVRKAELRTGDDHFGIRAINVGGVHRAVFEVCPVELLSGTVYIHSHWNAPWRKKKTKFAQN